MSALPTPWLLNAYSYAMTALEPVAMAVLAYRERRGKEDPKRLAERRGKASLARPNGRLAWLHGASVGETISLLPVVERLTARGLTVLVTSGTRTSAQILARRLPPGAIHHFVPLDVPRYVARFLDHWRPDLALIAESEIWPNTIMETHRRGIPLLLVNARLSERSFKRWQALPNVMGALLSRFDLCMAQSRMDAERLARLGAPRVSVAGNLKFDVPPPPGDVTMLAVLSGLLAGRPVWAASSVHPGEDEAVIAAHLAAAQHHPGLLTMAVPRHPQRGEIIAALAQEAGLRTARRSLGEQPERDVDIYIADTIGEVGLVYRLAPVVFMGGSLVPHGGQNPIEPAKLGAAVLHGPHVHNFEDIYAALDKANASLPVVDAQTLAEAVTSLLRDAARSRAMARSAGQVVDNLSGAVNRTVQALEPYFMAMSLEQL